MVEKSRKAPEDKVGNICCDGSHPTTIATTSPPPWFASEKIWKSLNAIPMLAVGEHPKSLVLRDLEKMPRGMIYELVTPFVPVPLINAVCARGHLSWTREVSLGTFQTYFIHT
jgi:hypothetical protein